MSQKATQFRSIYWSSSVNLAWYGNLYNIIYQKFWDCQTTPEEQFEHLLQYFVRHLISLQWLFSDDFN